MRPVQACFPEDVFQMWFEPIPVPRSHGGIRSRSACPTTLRRSGFTTTTWIAHHPAACASMPDALVNVSASSAPTPPRAAKNAASTITQRTLPRPDSLAPHQARRAPDALRYDERQRRLQRHAQPRANAFENFVVGSNNQMAHARLSLARRPVPRAGLQSPLHLRRHRPRQNPSHARHRALHFAE